MGMTAQLIGTRLGAYEVRAILGNGGMGSVYRGYDPALDREVAIKVMTASGLLPDAVQRFRREARLAAALRHPHIVQVYAFGEQSNTLYMVQELLPGPTLAQRIPRGNRKRMGPIEIKQIISQLASALDYAHGRGVVHRDVKPANALYNAAGDLVLTDFGLARPAADVQTTATGPGVVMGTPGYVAPEQAVSSAGVTKACDIYALGVLLFELLTGRLPFEADTSMGMVLKHLYDEPPKPSSLRADLPKAVDAVVLRALRKEPEKRFAGAGALAEALAEAWPNARERGAAAQPARSPQRIRAQPAEKPAATTPRPRPEAVEKAGGASSRPRPDPSPRARTEPAKRAEKAGGASLRSRPEPSPRARTEPAKRARTEPAPAKPSPAPRRGPRLRVGLLTACIVGVLLLYGFGIGATEIGQGWEALRAMIER
jgi:serine/threonine-protein kinase